MAKSLLSGGKRTLIVLFIPSVERDGRTTVDQERWVTAALEMFGDVYGGATAYPKAKGVWRDDERGGALVFDEPVVIHCYTTPANAQTSEVEEARSILPTHGTRDSPGRDRSRHRRSLLRDSRVQGVEAMKDNNKLDVKKIAKALGAEHRGKVTARGGHFGAAQLVAEIQSRFRIPASGGRATNPEWTERRLVPLAPKTLTKLAELATRLRDEGVAIEPLQLAALLLEASVDDHLIKPRKIA